MPQRYTNNLIQTNNSSKRYKISMKREHHELTLPWCISNYQPLFCSIRICCASVIAYLVYLMSIYKKCLAGYAVLMGSERDLSMQR